MDDEDQSSFQPYLDDSNWYSTSGRPYATSSTKGKADKSSKEDSNQDNSLSDTDGVYDVPLSDSTRSKQQTGLDEDKYSDGDKLKSSPLYNDDKSSSYSDYSAIVTGKKTMLSTRIVTLTYAPPTSSVPDDVSSSKTSATFSQATSIPSVRTIPNSLLITSSSSLSSSSLLSSISTIPTFKSSTLSSTTSIYSTSIISSSSIIAVSTSTPSYLPAIKDKSAPTPQNYTVPIVVGVIAGAVMIGMLAFAVVRMRKNRKTRQRWSTYTESAYRDPFGTSMEQSRHHSYSA